MTNPRFVPSAGLLLAIAACSAEFSIAVPATIEPVTSLVSSWSPERDREGDSLPRPGDADEGSSDPDANAD
ncbi:hypothetical protein [Microcella sp.]|uniref:hypothetical protein n=1 Tax=Microcella sp. TaxID=1913979 RepID=UPI003F714895